MLTFTQNQKIWLADANGVLALQCLSVNESNITVKVLHGVKAKPEGGFHQVAPLLTLSRKEFDIALPLQGHGYTQLFLSKEEAVKHFNKSYKAQQSAA